MSERISCLRRRDNDFFHNKASRPGSHISSDPGRLLANVEGHGKRSPLDKLFYHHMAPAEHVVRTLLQRNLVADTPSHGLLVKRHITPLA